jgi:uncharacterized membrane protein YuzA (DUF378 family)
MRGMSIIAKAGLLAAVVGAGSWLVVGIWHYNFVADIFGSGKTPSAPAGERIIYIVFGAGAVICLPLLAAAFGRSRAGRRYTAGEEPVERSRPVASTQQQTPEGQQLVDYQEFKEFQAWRAGKQAQQAAMETSPVPSTEEPVAEVAPEDRRVA